VFPYVPIEIGQIRPPGAILAPGILFELNILNLKEMEIKLMVIMGIAVLLVPVTLIIKTAVEMIKDKRLS
jgi:hypothetical protein